MPQLVVYCGLVLALSQISVSTRTYLVETGSESSKLAQTRSKSKIKPRILGGRDVVAKQEVPWQVGVYKPQAPMELYVPTCGGTIIDPTHVLTAAHCVVRNGITVLANKVQVFSGSTIKWKGLSSKVANISVHPDYNRPPLANDLAVLRLVKPLDLTGPLTRPACLPRRPLARLVGRNATASGWGQVVPGERSGDQLQVIDDLPILADCLDEEIKARIAPGMFCAGGQQDKDVCYGDSGGPLVMKALPGCDTATLVGTVSFGFWCGNKNRPSVYSDIYYFLQHKDRWLCKALEQGPGTCPPPTARV